MIGSGSSSSSEHADGKKRSAGRPRSIDETTIVSRPKTASAAADLRVRARPRLSSHHHCEETTHYGDGERNHQMSDARSYSL